MASSSLENLATMEPWTFLRPTPTTLAADSWISEAFARDAETLTLTRALQKSISTSTSNSNSNSNSTSSFFPDELIHPTPPLSFAPLPPPPSTASNVSGSDPETPDTAPKRPRTAVPPAASGKVSKRKSRASKRSNTTFITADPANFRQMVQQVTGVRFGSSLNPILKPEALRAGSRSPNPNPNGGLPTLDTSAFLLDHLRQQQPCLLPIHEAALPLPLPLPSPPSASTLNSPTFPSFPTLESWKA